MKGETKERRKQDELLVRLAAAPGPCCLKVASWERQPVIAKSEGKYYKLEKREWAGEREGDREKEREDRKWKVFPKQNLKLFVHLSSLIHSVTGRGKKEHKGE